MSRNKYAKIELCSAVTIQYNKDYVVSISLHTIGMKSNNGGYGVWIYTYKNELKLCLDVLHAELEENKDKYKLVEGVTPNVTTINEIMLRHSEANKLY